MYLEFLSALRAAVKTSWPEAATNGIWMGYQLAQVPFERLAEAGKLPVAVLDLDLRSSEEWGAGNNTEEGTVSIYYVVNDAVPVNGLIEKLEALRAALWEDGLTTGQITQFPSVSFSMQLPPNAYFINAQKPLYAGVVTFNALLGEYEE